MEEVETLPLLNYILDNDVDTAIIRIPSVELASLNSLERTGMPYFIADTLVSINVLVLLCIKLLMKWFKNILNITKINPIQRKETGC